MCNNFRLINFILYRFLNFRKQYFDPVNYAQHLLFDLDFLIQIIEFFKRLFHLVNCVSHLINLLALHLLYLPSAKMLRIAVIDRYIKSIRLF